MGDYIDYVNRCEAAVHYDEVAGDEKQPLCWTCDCWHEHPTGQNPGWCDMRAEWKNDDADACDDYVEKVIA